MLNIILMIAIMLTVLMMNVLSPIYRHKETVLNEENKILQDFSL